MEECSIVCFLIRDIELFFSGREEGWAFSSNRLNLIFFKQIENMYFL